MLPSNNKIVSSRFFEQTNFEQLIMTPFLFKGWLSEKTRPTSQKNSDHELFAFWILGKKTLLNICPNALCKNDKIIEIFVIGLLQFLIILYIKNKNKIVVCYLFQTLWKAIFD